MDYIFFMEQALKQARNAFSKGQFPVGCVIVQDDLVIATGARTGTSGALSFFSEIDHAEIRALKVLESLKVRFVPERAVLFCTMEPCLMCFAAIILAGIRTVVFAYEDVMGGGTGLDRKHLTPLYKDAQITIVPNVLRKKSLDLFHNFFNKDANLYWKDSLLESYTLEQWRKSGA